MDAEESPDASFAFPGLAAEAELNLPKAWHALWTLARHPGVEPASNRAERALRGAVIYRTGDPRQYFGRGIPDISYCV